MSAEIINLSKFRKAKARAEKARLAAENRARRGQSKADRLRTTIEREREARQVDNSKLAASDPDDDLDPGAVS